MFVMKNLVGTVLLAATLSTAVLAQSFPRYNVNRSNNGLWKVTFEKTVTVRVHKCGSAAPFSQYTATGNYRYAVGVRNGQYMTGKTTNGGWTHLSGASRC